VRPRTVVAGSPAREMRDVDASRYMDLRDSIGDLQEALTTGQMSKSELKAMEATFEFFENLE